MGYVGNAPYQGIVGEGNIADNAVTTSKIAPDTVVAADIAAGAVGASELANDAVTTDKILNSSVTAAKLAPGAAVPSQTGNAGKFLTTDGTTASWAVIQKYLSVINRSAVEIQIGLQTISGSEYIQILTNSGSTVNVPVN
jgi:hypothetical protein